MEEQSRWRRYLRLWGPDPRADVEDELAFHIAERAAWHEARGLAPDEARKEAERRFGDITRIRGEILMAATRQSRRIALHERIGDFIRDVRHAFRSLAAAPVFALTAGAALALGIGANAAVFTVVSAVLLRPLPYAEPERVVTLYNRWQDTPEAGISPAEYLDLAEQARAFESVGVYAGTFVNLVEGDAAARLPAAVATPSALHALGVAAAEGRLFSTAEGEPGSDPIVVLSHEFWRSHFSGSRNVIGSTLLINGTAMTVIGVLPADVRLPNTYAAAEPPVLFFPYRPDRTAAAARGSHFLAGVARLAPGWTLESANTELRRIAQRIVAQYPDDYPAEMQFDTYAQPVHADVVGDSRRLLMMLTGAVALVLLIASANVAGLVLTRTEERRRELAVRSALGAGRWRIARQLLIEHLVLAGIAGAAGLLLAYTAVEALSALRPAQIPRLDAIRLDTRVLAFTATLSIAATLCVALVPLVLGGIAHGALREAGTRTTATRAAQRMRSTLITAEVALSIVLLAGAGLLLRSFMKLLAVDPGYRTEQLLAVPISLPPAGYSDDDARRRFFSELVAQTAQLPGVHAAGAVLNLPLATRVGDLNIQIEGRIVADTDVSPRLDWQVITPGWFDAMGIELVRGRGVLLSDDAQHPGAVVLSESAARKYWPDVDAIGQRFKLGGNAGPGWVTVVGIVRDVRHSALADEPPALMYLPHAQFTFWNGGTAPSSMTLVVHTAGEPTLLLPAIREQVRRMNPQVPLGRVRSMTQVLNTAVATPRFATSILSSFALLSLLLALIGVYGLVSYTVSRRTRELAVRIALGAEPRRVMRQVLVKGMQPVIIGVVLGTIAALTLTRVLEQMLYGVPARDPATMIAALLLLPLAALGACLLPALRVTRIAPLTALAAE